MSPETHDRDERDEQMAALLEVPPLDDVTRRRLVRGALAEAATAPGRGRRPGRWLVAAAVAVGVLAIGGVTALVLRDEGNGSETVAGKAREATPGDADTASGAAAATPQPLGDLGDVSEAAALRARLASFTDVPPPSAADETEATTANVALPCLDAAVPAGTGPVTRAGTGTYDGTPAVVLVAARDGAEVAFVLDASTCAVLAEVPLV